MMIPHGKVRGDFDAQKLRKIGMEVGWDWDANDDEMHKTTNTGIFVPNGMVDYYVKAFYELEK